jgi:hypothetical protein
VGHVSPNRILSEEENILTDVNFFIVAIHYRMTMKEGRLVHELRAKYEKAIPSSRKFNQSFRLFVR